MSTRQACERAPCVQFVVHMRVLRIAPVDHLRRRSIGDTSQYLKGKRVEAAKERSKAEGGAARTKFGHRRWLIFRFGRASRAA